MTFKTDINMGHPDKGPLKKNQEDVACLCWFTSQGRMLPKMVKIQDERGELHQIDSIQVEYSQKTRYCGIGAVEYACHTVVDGRQHCFRLIFYPESCRWVLLK